MLQMLNVDIKKSNTAYNGEQGGTDNEASGDEEFRGSQSNIGKKNGIILPQLRGNNPAALNNSADNVKSEDENNLNLLEENKNDNYKPKM